ncbi:hypothetical protein CLOM621_08445 [Clostridium sp. M62/1]|nr:hypothetical protein CLOM621_08445 [Clostridium sp. M62/1]
MKVQLICLLLCDKLLPQKRREVSWTFFPLLPFFSEIFLPVRLWKLRAQEEKSMWKRKGFLSGRGE